MVLKEEKIQSIIQIRVDVLFGSANEKEDFNTIKIPCLIARCADGRIRPVVLSEIALCDLRFGDVISPQKMCQYAGRAYTYLSTVETSYGGTITEIEDQRWGLKL